MKYQLTKPPNPLGLATLGTRIPSAHLLKTESLPLGTSTNKASRRNSCVRVVPSSDKVRAFVTTGFFAARKGRWKDNRNMKVSILDLESEVVKTVALLELVSERLVQTIEERGGTNASASAAGLVALSIDQAGNLTKVFYAVCELERGQRSVRN